MTESTIDDIALSYLAYGWSVIPIVRGGKRPLLSWQVFQERLAEKREVADWFRRWPSANIAIVTGALSGLVVMDLDPKHGGEQSLMALRKRHGALPATVEAETGGGGLHFYFAHPGGIVRNKVGLVAGIDLRGDGGYVVAPPSRHASGRAYSWRKGCAPADIPLAPFPAWLTDCPEFNKGATAHSPHYWRQLVREGVGQGERNNTIASFCGHLLRHRVDVDVVIELLLCWNALRCRPPLSHQEVIRTVQSIARLHQGNADQGKAADESDGSRQTPQVRSVLDADD